FFLASGDACLDRFEAVLKKTAEGRSDAEIGAQLQAVGHDPSGHPHLTGPGARLHAMGHAYMRLLAKPEAPLMQMQAYAACWDDDVRRLVRDRWQRLRILVSELRRVEGPGLSDSS